MRNAEHARPATSRVGSGLAQDVRLAIRGLLRSRLISVVAILTLSIAIGATTAVFSLVNSLLLRPLPVVQPDRLVWISSEYAVAHGFTAGAGWNAAMWDELQPRLGQFGGALAWRADRATLGRSGEIERADALYVSGGFFATLGVSALDGRVLRDADDRRGGGADGLVAVISHRLWKRRFAGAPAVVGTPIEVEGVPVTIVGVTPAAFLGLESGRGFDIALPLGAEPVLRGKGATLFQPRNFSLLVMLRLNAGQTIESATRTLRGLQREVVPADAPVFVQEPFVLVPAARGAANPGAAQRIYERPLTIMLAGVGLVLLIACVNIANLLLARAAARRHDLGMRVALGASRWRLARLVLVESALLATAGAVCGLLLAVWSARALVALTPVSLDASMDWRVAAFTAAVAIATALLVGLAPALRAAQVPAAIAVRTGGRNLAGHGPGRLANGLAVAQIALALVLMIAAGLLVRTFTALGRLPLGFDAGRVLVASVDTVRAETDPVRRLGLAQRLADAVSATPGVERAAGSFWTPLSGEGMVIGMGSERDKDNVNVLANFVTPGWFGVYGMAIRQGRDVSPADTVAAPPVVVVNEAFVRRFVPNGNAIGSIALKNQTIVGVVGDAVSRSAQRIPGVTSLALREPVPPTIYVPLAQAPLWNRPPSTTVQISIRPRAGAAAAVAPSTAAALAAVDSNVAFTFRPLVEDVRSSLSQERTVAWLAAAFGTLSLLLAAVGLYGLISYRMGLRRTEIGVRMAVGASRASVIRLVLGYALWLIGLGSAAGLVAAGLLTRALSSLLFGVTPFDPVTFLGVALLLGLIGTLAALVPAWRASRVDPATALRGI